jgi:hypothetical protein
MSVIHQNPCISERSRGRREPEHASLPSTLNSRVSRSTALSQRRRLDCLSDGTGLGAGSFDRPDRRDHFDASIAGKTYVNLNDLGCERIIDAGRPRTVVF